jgi:hypothetical protein
MSELSLSASEIDYLLSPTAIRERAEVVFDFTVKGEGHFSYHQDRFKPAVAFVHETIKTNYPDGNIPFHSRWGHFRAGKDRTQELDQKLMSLDPLERARVKLDLVITSVLLDAGAGKEWSYFEESSRASFARSEGLGVASFHMFLSGAMSSDGQSMRADLKGLAGVSEEDLCRHFQVDTANPLLGAKGRVELLNNLSKAVANKAIFKDGRPGNIIDYLAGKYGKEFSAVHIFRAVLDGFGVIWPGRLTASGVNLGDVWKHKKTNQLIPFHKLSQWMTYSLIEPIQDAGFKITGVDGLTGLAEYRNGGLMLDSGLIQLRDPANAGKKWQPDSDLIIEWRALTVYLLDRIAEDLRQTLKKTPEEFPLAKVLEGGTWWAGRFLAKEKRAGGEPPLQIESDGTVF